MENKRRIGIGIDLCSHKGSKHFTSVAVSDLGLNDIEILSANEEKGGNITEEIIALVESCMNSYFEHDAIYTVCFNSESIKWDKKLGNSIIWLLTHKLGFKHQDNIINEKRTLLETNVIALFEKTGNGFIKHLPDYMLTEPKPNEYNAGILAVAAIYFQLGELELLKSVLRIEKLRTLSRELKGGKYPTEDSTYPTNFLTDNDNFGEMLPGLD